MSLDEQVRAIVRQEVQRLFAGVAGKAAAPGPMEDTNPTNGTAKNGASKVGRPKKKAGAKYVPVNPDDLKEGLAVTVAVKGRYGGPKKAKVIDFTPGKSKKVGVKLEESGKELSLPPDRIYQA